MKKIVFVRVVGWFWSSSPDSTNPAYGWDLDFGRGAATSVLRYATTAERARCVR